MPLLLISKRFKLLAFFCDCTAWFVSDLVENPNCWFSHAQAHIEFSQTICSKILDAFLIFDQNIDCGYTLEPPHQSAILISAFVSLHG